MNFHEAFIDELVKVAGEIGQAANTLAAMQHRIPASRWLMPKVRPSLEVLTEQARRNALAKIQVHRQLGVPNPVIRSKVIEGIKRGTGAAYFRSEPK